jgi:membrane-associated phospholipid phosphatase
MNRSSILEKDWRWSARLRLRQDKGIIHWLAAFLAHSGDSWFWLVGLGLVWLLKTGQWHRTAAIMEVAILLLAGIVLAIKLLVRRRRPAGEWGAIYRSIDPHSFPSGHAARAIMLAVLACGLAPAWFAVLLVIWAPCVSLARVLMGVHYLTDIVAGIAVGLVVGLAVLAAQPLLVNFLPFLFQKLI